MTKSALAIFEDFKIRRHYDKKTETWYVSIVDVIYALTQSNNPQEILERLKKPKEVSWLQIVVN